MHPLVKSPEYLLADWRSLMGRISPRKLGDAMGCLTQLSFRKMAPTKVDTHQCGIFGLNQDGGPIRSIAMKQAVDTQVVAAQILRFLRVGRRSSELQNAMPQLFCLDRDGSKPLMC